MTGWRVGFVVAEEHFIKRLIKMQENVAITPGLSFGDAFDGYIRLAFTLEEGAIREGIGRIRHFLENQ